MGNDASLNNSNGLSAASGAKRRPLPFAQFGLSAMVMTTRRDFVAGAMAGLALPGCRLLPAECMSKGRSATYWCTWATQAATLKCHLLTGELKFPGDQGVPGVRVLARDILGGESVDITAQCHRAARRIVLPGDVIAGIGSSQNGNGDDSQPGAVILVQT